MTVNGGCAFHLSVRSGAWRALAVAGLALVTLAAWPWLREAVDIAWSVFLIVIGAREFGGLIGNLT